VRESRRHRDLCSTGCSAAVHLTTSEVADRSLHFLLLETGTTAIANWYRPASSDTAHINSLQEDLAELGEETSGYFFMGDVNIHHRRWLRYSIANTMEGSVLKEICDEYALQQLVKEPARGEYLLDAALTDLPESNAKLLPFIADTGASYFQ